MFFQMLWNTGLVFAEIHSLKQAVSLLWTFSFPWDWAYHGTLFHPASHSLLLDLQCHADIYRTWGCNNDLVQTEKLVRLLSDGNNDSAHL